MTRRKRRSWNGTLAPSKIPFKVPIIDGREVLVARRKSKINRLFVIDNRCPGAWVNSGRVRDKRAGAYGSVLRRGVGFVSVDLRLDSDR